MIGEDIDVGSLTLLEWMQLRAISFEELEDWQDRRRWGDLERRGIREVIPAREAFDVFCTYMGKSSPLRLIHERSYSTETIKTYTYVLKQFEAYCKGVNPNMEAYQVVKHIIDFLVKMKEERNLCNRTVNKYIAALRAFIHHVADRYKMDITNLPGYAKLNKGLPKALNRRQVEGLLRAASKQYYAHRYAFLVEFLLFTGLRRSEFLQLQVHDLDFDMGIVEVRNGKGGTTRSIPVPTEFLEYVQFYLTQMGITEPEHYVMGNHADPSKPITAQRLEQMFLTLVRQVSERDRNGIHLHSLRHTCATYLYLTKKTPLKEISKFLGHSNIESTAIYTQLDVEGLRHMVEPGLEYISGIIDGAFRG